MNSSKINPVKIESEHLQSYNKTKIYYKKYGKMPPKSLFFKWIVTDHLKEYGKKYYPALVKMEKSLKKR